MRIASLAYKLKYIKIYDNEEWGGGLSNDLKKKPTKYGKSKTCHVNRKWHMF